MWWVTSGVGSSTPARHHREHAVDVGDHVGVAGAQGQRLDPEQAHVHLARARRRRRCTATRAALARQADRDVERARVADGVDARRRRRGPRCAARPPRAGPPRSGGPGCAPKRLAPSSRRSGTVSIAITCAAPAARAACTAHRPTGPEAEHGGGVAGLQPAVGDGVEAGAHHVAGEQRDVVASCPRAPCAATRLAFGTSACSACVPCSEPSVAPWPNVRDRSRTCGSRRGGRRSSVPQAVLKAAEHAVADGDARVTPSPAATPCRRTRGRS